MAMMVIFNTITATSSTEDSFSLLFYDNRDVFTDKPIVFENPLPKWLRGSLVRTGPSLFGNGPRNFTHAFDGFAKIYNWKFYGNGSASFSMNFLRSEVYNVSMEINNVDNFLTFQKPIPPFSLAEQEMAIIKGMDNTNVNVYRCFNKAKQDYEYVTLTDTWKLYQIDPLSVGTVGPINAQKPSGTEVFINMMSSAHPVPEHGTGHHFTFLTSVSFIPGVKHRLSVVRIKSAFERELVAQWEVDKAPYMHAFSVTPNYVILFAPPYYVNMVRMLENADAFSGLEWFPSKNATIYVVEIKTGKVLTLNTPNTNPSHHINAYEEDNKIVMDVFVYEDPFFVKSFDLDTARNVDNRNNAEFAPQIRRFTIDLDRQQAKPSTFSASAKFPFINDFEVPAINENYRHRKYCYVYGVAFRKDKTSFSNTALIKKDVCGHNQDNAWFEEGHFPVEMWFVPTPNSTTEDDGILLTPVLHGEKRQTYLLMLNATTMTTINRAYLPTLVPFTIHGRFFPDVI